MTQDIGSNDQKEEGPNGMTEQATLFTEKCTRKERIDRYTSFTK